MNLARCLRRGDSFDIQDHSSYTTTMKKQCLINNSISIIIINQLVRVKGVIKNLKKINLMLLTILSRSCI